MVASSSEEEDQESGLEGNRGRRARNHLHRHKTEASGPPRYI